MTHYHVVAAKDGAFAISSVQYENYEDSIAAWVGLSNHVFKYIESEDGALAVENAKEATEYGEGIMARVGTSTLCFYWTRCDEACYSITWN